MGSRDPFTAIIPTKHVAGQRPSHQIDVPFAVSVLVTFPCGWHLNERSGSNVEHEQQGTISSLITECVDPPLAEVESLGWPLAGTISPQKNRAKSSWTRHVPTDLLDVNDKLESVPFGDKVVPFSHVVEFEWVIYWISPWSLAYVNCAYRRGLDDFQSGLRDG